MELKRLSPGAIPAALEKAELYRLLNEPKDAESICLDILELEPDNERALVTLLLARTDEFSHNLSVTEAKAVVPRLADEYHRLYYTGIIHERHAKAILRRGAPGASFHAHDGFREAMEWFEKAMALSPQGNDEAVLRWNSCARIIEAHRLAPREEPAMEHMLE